MKIIFHYTVGRFWRWLKDIEIFQLLMSFFTIVLIAILVILIPSCIIANISENSAERKACQRLEADGWTKQEVYEHDRNSAELLIYKRLDIKYGVGNWKASVTNIGNAVYWKVLDK